MTTHNNQLNLENFATPENFRIVLEILKEILPALTEILKERLVEQTVAIGLLSQKLDQIITREIYSGLSAIKDAATTTNEETRQIRLRFAEEHLLRNTQLDSKLETGGKKNGYWMAQSNYGCMNICLLRGDEKIAHKHLLSVFECDPRLARTSLTPEIWEKIFKPECKGIYTWFDKEYKEIKSNQYGGRVALRKAGAVAKFAGQGALIAWSVWNTRRAPIGAPNIADELSKDWDGATPQKYQDNAIKKLKEELENKIDERCREFAVKLIAAI